MPFTFQKLEISEVILVDAKSFSDERGFFLESFKESFFTSNGINTRFVQDNFSHSIKGVLRGLHYQKNPQAQAKLVTALRGEIFDVAVDIRKDSPTYGKWVSEILSENNHKLLYIPEGFAHGFCVLSKEADVLYKVNNEYSSEHERVFLVGFFLSIGLSGAPNLEALGVAVLLAVVVPLKVALFFFLLTRFTLRARTSLLASFRLANYSEFGLIVAAVGAAGGWFGNEWLVIIGIALSITFVVASPLNTAAHSIYARFAERLRPFETTARHPEELPVDPGEAEIAIFGMGRVGTGAYDAMRERYGDIVIGIDYDAATVREHQGAGRNVIQGDATDPDFWERAKERRRGKVRLVMLAMPQHKANMDAAKFLAREKYLGFVSATAQFRDEVEALEKAGVHAAFNFFEGAGAGFAGHVAERLEGSDRN